MHLYPDVSSTILRILLLSSAAFTVAMITPATAQQSQRPRLAAAQCQPLTEANFALCCIAANRTSILSAAQIDMCPPVTTALITAALNDGGDGDGGNGGGDKGRGN
ncbi:MAG: hypothetical protein EOR89_33205, partial [Mesorhizobium sp.]